VGWNSYQTRDPNCPLHRHGLVPKLEGVEGDSRQATLRCSAPGLSVLPLGLAHPLHLPHHLHLAADSDLVLDLADPLHLAADSDSAATDKSGDDADSESSKESDLKGSLPDQSHHPEEGEAEDGDCHLVADRPCLHAILYGAPSSEYTLAPSSSTLFHLFPQHEH
jgi:hypothetical protein